MQLVERHVIKRADPRFKAIDRAAFASKNLYNAANYLVRQSFIHDGVYLDYHEMDRRMQDHEAYQALPAKVAQWVLRLLDKNWQSCFAARLPLGRKTPRSSWGVRSCRATRTSRQGATCWSTPRRRSVSPRCDRADCALHAGHHGQDQAAERTSRSASFPVAASTWWRSSMNERQSQRRWIPALHAGCDIGLNNLATLASDKPGFLPRVVNGRPVKSINQFYNRRRAEVQSQLDTAGAATRADGWSASPRSARGGLTTTCTPPRGASSICWSLRASATLCIGKNPLWKQEANMGKRNNQNFVSVPHARFIQMLTYKAELVGIQVRITEESYTSKASFLDGDPLPVYGAEDIPAFSGKRVKRGLYRAADGRHINADVNGAYNIIRKVAPECLRARE